MITVSPFCRFCGMALREERILDRNGQLLIVWVDETDGDCCSGDDECNNENKSHVPA